MIHRYLGDYHNFTCIADKCPATCCSGWLIEIDDEYLERYRSDEGPLKNDFKERIDWDEHCFKQQDNGDCAFLRPDGLCHMQKNLGEEILCKTCASFPRHTEEFPGIREHSLSMSCPAVAQAMIDTILANQAYNLTWSTDAINDDVDSSDYEDFNQNLYELMYDARNIAYEILSNVFVPFDIRAELIASMMSEIQTLYDTDESEKSSFVFDYFLSNDATNAISDAMAEDDCYTLTEDLKESFSILFDLEPLNDQFRDFEEKAFDLLFHQLSAEELFDTIQNFKVKVPQLESLQTTIATYFISTYMCGAVYDEYIYSQTEQAFFHSRMLLLLWTYAWLTNNEQLSNEQMATILYKYCREIENSNENLIELEKLLD